VQPRQYTEISPQGNIPEGNIQKETRDGRATWFVSSCVKIKAKQNNHGGDDIND
jgi:hypothetical protein